MGKKTKRHTVIIIIIAVTMAVIWGHSVMPPDASSDESGFVMNLMRPVLEVFTGRGNVTEYLVRKLGHFTEYMILGGELSFLFTTVAGERFQRFSGLNRLLLILVPALIWALITAFLDETIQIFSGRGPMIKDVWIDLAGAAAGIIIILITRSIAGKCRKKRKKPIKN